MANRDILGDLAAGKLSNIDWDIVDYLGDIRSDSNSVAQQREHGLFAVRFLHKSVSLVPAATHPELMTAIHYSYKYYRERRENVKLSDPLMLPKILYHILLAQQDQLSEIDKVASYLLDELTLLSDNRDPGVATIISSCYGNLWNVAYKQELEKQFTQFDLTLSLRQLALQILSLKSDSQLTILDKALLAVRRLDQQLKADRSRNVDDILIALNEFLATVCSLLQQKVDPGSPDCVTIANGMYEMQSLHSRIQTENTATAGFDDNQILKQLFSLHEFICPQCSADMSQQFGVVVDVCTIAVNIFSYSANKSNNASAAEPSSLMHLDKANKMISSLLMSKSVNDAILSSLIVSYSFLLSVFKNSKDRTLFPESILCLLIEGADVLILLRQQYRSCIQSGEEKKYQQNLAGLTEAHHVQLQALFGILQRDVTQGEATVKQILSTVSEFLLILDSGALTTKHQQVDRHDLGAYMVKIGHFCYNHSLDDFAMQLYSVACEQLSLWCRTDAEKYQQRIQEVSLWKVYDYLADTQRRAGQSQAAMATVVSSLLVDSSHMTSVAKTWFRIKKSVKDANNLDLITRTMKQVLDCCDENCTNIDMKALLQCELQACKSTGHRLYRAEYAVLLDLLQLDLSAEERASVLVDLAQILWLKEYTSERSAVEYLQEAISLLSDCRGNEALLTLAQANLQYFSSHYDQLRHQVLSSPHISVPNNSSSKTQSPSIPLFTLCMENESTEPLNQALRLWERVLTSDQLADLQVDVAPLLAVLEFHASFYELLLKPLPELRIISLARKIAILIKDTRARGRLSCRMAEVLDSLGRHGEAASVLVAMETECSHESEADRVMFILAKAEHCLHTGEVSDGVASVLGVLESSFLQKNRTKSVCLMEGIARRLLSRFRALPVSNFEGTNENSLELAHEAVRLHVGVVHFILGKDFINSGCAMMTDEQPLDRNSILRHALTSLLHLGQMYRQIGDYRDSKCFLKEGLKFAQVMCLSRWSAQFLLELSRLHVLSGNHDDIYTTSGQLGNILNSASSLADLFPAVPVAKDLVVESPDMHNSQTEERLTSDDCFGFNSPKHSDNVFEEKMDLIDDCPNLYTIPEPKASHSDDCVCLNCEDVSAQMLQLQHCLLEAETSSLVGRSDHAKTLLNSYLNWHGNIGQKSCLNISHTIDNICFLSTDVGNAKSIELAVDPLNSPVYLLEYLLEAYSQLCSIALLEKAPEDTIKFARKGLALNVGGSDNACVLRARLQLGFVYANYPVQDDPFVTFLESTLEDRSNVKSITDTMSDLIINVSNNSAPKTPCHAENRKDSKRDNATKTQLTNRAHQNGTPQAMYNDMSIKRTSKKGNRKPVAEFFTPIKRDTAGRQLANSSFFTPDMKMKTKTPTTLYKTPGTTLGRQALLNFFIESSDEEKKTPLFVKHKSAIKAKASVKRTAQKKQATECKQTVCAMASLCIYEDSIIDSVPDIKHLKPKASAKAKSTRKKKPSKSQNTDSDIDTIADKNPNIVEEHQEVNASSPLNKLKTEIEERYKDIGTGEATHGSDICMKTPSVSSNTPRCAFGHQAALDFFLNSSDEEIKTPIFIKKKTSTKASSRATKKKKPCKSSKEDSSAPVVRLQMESKEDDVNGENENVKKAASTKRTSRKPAKKTIVSEMHPLDELSKNQNEISIAATLDCPIRDHVKISGRKAPALKFVEKCTISETEHKENSEPAELSIPSSKIKTKRSSRLPKPTKNTPVKLIEDDVKLEVNNVMKKVSNIKQKRTKAALVNNKSSKSYDNSFQSNVDTDNVTSSTIPDVFYFDEVDPPSVVKKKETKAPAKAKSKESCVVKAPRSRRARKADTDMETARGECETQANEFQYTDILPRSPLKSNEHFSCITREMRTIHPDPKDTDIFEEYYLGECPNEFELSDEDMAIEMLRTDTDETDITKCKRGRAKKATKPATGTKNIPCEPESSVTGEQLIRDLPDVSARLQSVEQGDADTNAAGVLQAVYRETSHLPKCPEHRKICHMLALRHLATDPVKAAFYLNEAMALTFRHQALLNLCQQIRKLMKSDAVPVKDQTANLATKDKPSVLDREEQGARDRQRPLVVAREGLQFGKDEQFLQKMVDSIPKEWTVCQVSMVTSSLSTHQLIVTRFSSQRLPLVLRLPGFQTKKGQKLLPEFSSIIAESCTSMKLTDKAEWWSVRRDLNDRIQTLQEDIENIWLCGFKGVFLGKLSCISDQEKLAGLEATVREEILSASGKPVPHAAVESLIGSCHSMTEMQLSSALYFLSGLEVGSSQLSDIRESVIRSSKQLNAGILQRLPVILILDKDIQHLPWESMPILRQQPVTRIPSLYHLHTQLHLVHNTEDSVLIRGVNPRNTSYILNPDQNLPATQKKFEDWFQNEEGWKGLVEKPPTPEQFTNAHRDHDLFIYCGHGSGSKYLVNSELQQQRCGAVALLMGCSSGRLEVKGQLEALGNMLNYFLAGCPCVVANLWDVTDKDIDRFLECLLKTWLSAPGGTSILDVVTKARDVCKLPHLIGSAPVVYGFPVSIQK